MSPDQSIKVERKDDDYEYDHGPDLQIVDIEPEVSLEHKIAPSILGLTKQQIEDILNLDNRKKPDLPN